MAKHSPSNLPSDVVEDADFDVVDARVPTLGLHLHEIAGSTSEAFPWEKKQDLYSAFPWDNPKKRDSTSSRCDSGICESAGYLSSASSIRSSYGEPSIAEEGGVFSLNEKIRSLQLSSDTQLPGNRKSTIQTARISSVDEGFISEPISESIEEKPFKIVYPPESSEICVENTKQEQSEEDELDIDDRILDIFVQDEDGDTKLHMAIIQLLPDVAVQMMRLCPDVSLLCLQNTLGQTSLHLAVITQQVELVRSLLVMGVPLEQRDRNGNTALHIACRDGSLACVKALTSPVQGVDSPVQAIPQNLELWNYEGETCLHVAVLRGHVEILAYLTGLSSPANIDAKDGRSGRTVLHYAVESGNLGLVNFLIKQCGANPNAATFDGSKPMKLAVGRGLLAAQQLLLACGATMPTESTDESDYSDSDDDMEIAVK